ncbi:MAG: hypothetical protein ACTSYD_02535 [Candidatus Heimdallarchaeaceae archaeon]
MKPEPLKDAAIFEERYTELFFPYNRVESACKFFLRYWDKPLLLLKEQPQYQKELLKISPYFEKGKLYLIDDDEMAEYNKWLFKLSFRVAFAEVDTNITGSKQGVSGCCNSTKKERGVNEK